MKKIFSLFVLMLSLSLMTACGNTIEQKDLDESKELVTKYMDDMIASSLQPIEQYFVVNTKNREEYSRYKDEIEKKLDSNLKGMSELKKFFSDDVTTGLYDKVITAVLKKFEYEITSVEVSPDVKGRIIVKCSVNVPVLGESTINSEEYASMLNDYIDLSDSDKMIQTILERSKMTIEELSSKYSTMSQEEITKDMLSYYNDEINEYLSAIIDKMIENVSYTTSEKIMHMTKQSNDSWKILKIE